MIKIDKGDYLEIEIKRNKKKLYFKIDKSDSWVLDVFGFRYDNHYIAAHRYIKTEYGFAREDYKLHRLLLGIVKGFEVDHINRDKLDNRRCNLRLCTRGENNQNKAKAKNQTSKYRGVFWRGNKVNKKNPWGAYITKMKKWNHLGYFKTEEEAAQAYNKAALEKYGQHAYQNEIV